MTAQWYCQKLERTNGYKFAARAVVKGKLDYVAYIVVRMHGHLTEHEARRECWTRGFRAIHYITRHLEQREKDSE